MTAALIIYDGILEKGHEDKSEKLHKVGETIGRQCFDGIYFAPETLKTKTPVNIIQLTRIDYSAAIRV